MTDDAHSPRIGHLESIRGLASLQVLFLHVFSAFFSAIVFFDAGSAWTNALHYSPLYFLYDGRAAVYVFFVLSGVVLTFAFQRQVDRPVAAFAARLVRLWIPAAAACLFALALRGPFGDAHIAASAITGSRWLDMLWRPLPGLAYFLKDALGNSVLLGYHGEFPLGLDFTPAFLDPEANAYVAPLWSLNVELQGSLLILSMVAASRQSTKIWLLLLGYLGLVAFRSHFLCFIVGHLLATMMSRRREAGRSPFLPNALALPCLALGVLMCATAQWPLPAKSVCNLNLPLSLPCLHFPQKIYGAILVFIALAFSRGISRWLSRPELTWLGRMSFSIYLVHFPILMGCGSYLLVELTPPFGAAIARCLAGVLVIAATFAVAIPFARVDTLAARVGRRCRAWQPGGPTPVATPGLGGGAA